MDQSACETASDYEVALRRLPPVYSQVLQHTEAGTPDSEICAQLEIEPEGLEACGTWRSASSAFY